MVLFGKTVFLLCLFSLFALVGKIQVALKKAGGLNCARNSQLVSIYLLLVYLVTALVPSDTACLANSPGNKRRTPVWISRDEMVERPFK
jgi:hypothetical protein